MFVKTQNFLAFFYFSVSTVEMHCFKIDVKGKIIYIDDQATRLNKI